jgi:hypothetical protein
MYYADSDSLDNRLLHISYFTSWAQAPHSPLDFGMMLC